MKHFSKESSNIDPELLKDQEFIWHPCTQMKDHESDPPLLVDNAQGVYLYDREGNSYIDCISSWWVNLFGHNHPQINQAIKNQLEKMAHVMFAGVTHQPAIDLAGKLVQLSSPNLQKVFFSDNGSTSVEIALKLSLQYWRQTGRPQKTKFVYLKDAYHGETLGALSICGMDLFRDKFEKVLLANVQVDGPDCFRCPYDLTRETCKAECFDSMEAVLEKENETIAGIVIEPLVQGAAGMKMYPPVYLKKLETICQQLNVHTIYDEVAVGFGRTGSLFVSEKHGLNPTFLCLSKGITSGYLPLAATLTEDKIYDAFYDDFSTFKLFIHSHSYSANPLACSAANVSLDLLDEESFWEGLEKKVRQLGRYSDQFSSLKWCGEFRQTGMIVAVELLKNIESKTPFPVQDRIGYQIYLEGLKRGIFLRPLGNVIYFLPPLIINEEEIQFMMETAFECIKFVLNGK